MIFIIGGGGHARVVLDVLEECCKDPAWAYNMERIGIKPEMDMVDDFRKNGVIILDEFPDECKEKPMWSDFTVAHIEDHAALVDKERMSGRGGKRPINVYFFVAIGDNGARKKYYEEFKGYGYTPLTLISPNAYVSSSSTVLPGTLVNHGVVIQPGVTIGENIILNTGCQIDHDSTIGSHSHICPGVVICGGVSIGENVFMGAGSIVRDHVEVGDDVFIPMGGDVRVNMTTCY